MLIISKRPFKALAIFVFCAFNINCGTRTNNHDNEFFKKLDWIPKSSGHKFFVIVKQETEKNSPSLTILESISGKTVSVYEDNEPKAPWVDVITAGKQNEFLVLTITGGIRDRVIVLAYVDGKILSVFEGGSPIEIEEKGDRKFIRNFVSDFVNGKKVSVEKRYWWNGKTFSEK